MRSISRCWLLLTSLVIQSPAAWPQTASSGMQTASSGMTVHRVQAGVLDATGLSNASSTLGDFTVRIPCLFNDFRMLGQDKDPILDIDAIGCRRTDQRKYSASRIKYREGATAARKQFAEMSGPRRLEGETARRRLMFNGFPAIQVDFQSTSRCGSVRSLLVGTDLLTLTTEAPRSECARMTTLAESFFASLEVAPSITSPSPTPPPAMSSEPAQ